MQGMFVIKTTGYISIRMMIILQDTNNTFEGYQVQWNIKYGRETHIKPLTRSKEAFSEHFSARSLFVGIYQVFKQT